MDPLSIITSVIGTLAVAVQATAELKTMIGEFRDAPRELHDLRDELESLKATFGSLIDLFDANRDGIATRCPDLARHMEQDILGSKEVVGLLQMALVPFADGSWGDNGSSDGSNGGGKDGTSAEKRFSRMVVGVVRWTISKGHIRHLRTKLNDRQVGLVLRVEVLSAHLAGRSQDEIRRTIETEIGKLRGPIKTRRRHAKRLADDLESLVPDQDGSTWIDDQEDSRTDAGYALRNYMQSLPDKPPEGAAFDDLSSPVLDSEEFAARPPTPPTDPKKEPPAGIGISRSNTYDSPGRMFLRAVASGRRAAVRELLTEGSATLNDRNADGSTALHICAFYNDEGMANLLLQVADADGSGRASAGLRAKNGAGLTPLDIALEGENWEVVMVLIDHGCLLGGKFVTAFFGLLKVEYAGASAEVKKNMVQALARRQKSDGHAPFLLHLATHSRDVHALEMLLEAGFDVNAADRGILPIHVAACLRGLKELTLLVEHGADVNVYLPKPESLDSSVPYQDMLKGRIGGRDSDLLLLVSGNPSESSEIMPCLEYLLEHGANPSRHFKNPGDYLLQCLCLELFLPVAQALVEAGADVNVQNSVNGGSALFWATLCENTVLMRMLLERGARVDVQGKPDFWSGQTPLQRAIEERTIEVAQILVEAGADLEEIKDATGETALVKIRRIEEPDSVRALLEARVRWELRERGDSEITKEELQAGVQRLMDGVSSPAA